MSNEIKYYKVLGKGGVACNGGSGKWHLPLPSENEPGEWMPKIENIIPCQRGYHLCRREDLIVWLNAEIYEAEGKGTFIRHDDNKDVFQQARLISKMDNWNERTARLFAADCAYRVLPIFEKRYPNDNRPRKAIQAARDFANGLVTAAASDAAWDAAWDAASDAARAAAEYAARAAARAAAEYAARAAARATAEYAARAAARAAAEYAASDAERDAAWDAASDAERKWQTERLFYWLGGGQDGPI